MLTPRIDCEVPWFSFNCSDTVQHLGLQHSPFNIWQSGGQELLGSEVRVSTVTPSELAMVTDILRTPVER